MKPRQEFSHVFTLNSTERQRFNTRRRNEILTPSVQARQQPRETPSRSSKTGILVIFVGKHTSTLVMIVITHSIYLPLIVTIFTTWHSSKSTDYILEMRVRNYQFKR